MPTQAETLPLEVRYPVMTQMWIDSDNKRWTLLYYFLVAATVLLVAWATGVERAFDQPMSLAKLAVLTTLCIVGMFLSGLTLLMEERAYSFARAVFEAAVAMEGGTGVFSVLLSHRKTRGDRITSRLVVNAFPCLFLSLYVFLALVTLYLFCRLR